MNILIPTDFSSCANNAFKYACALARETEAILHIYHAANIPDGWVELSSAEQKDDPKSNEIFEAVWQDLQALKRSASGLGIEVEVHTSGRPFVENLAKLVESKQIDLVVLGSHGKNEKKENASWGSQTLRVVREIDQKVLVIRNGQHGPDFTTVMFATSLDKKERAVLRELLIFLDQFDVDRIHIVAIDTHDYFSQPSLIMTSALAEFKELAGRYDCVTHFFRSGSVEGGIRKFSEAYQVDLIALTNSHKNRLWRMVQGGKLESLVDQSELPVLSIPSKN